MACAAICGHNLGFDKTVGCLIADKKLQAHVVTVIGKFLSTCILLNFFSKKIAAGPGNPGDRFEISSKRINPAKAG